MPCPYTNFSFLAVSAPTDEIRTALFKNAKLKLLLTLCSLEELGLEDKPDTAWIIPPSLTSTRLAELQTTVTKSLETPWTDPDNSGREPEDLLRRVKTTATTAAWADDGDGAEPRRDAFIDDSEGSDDLQDFMFPDNVRSKNSDSLEQLKQRHKKRKLIRKKDQDVEDEALLDERRKARQQTAMERRRKIKSSLYIRDSDEEMDEEENRAFFAREEENRRAQAERVMRALTLGKVEEESSERGKKRKLEGGRQGGGKRRKSSGSEDERIEGEEDEDQDMEMMRAESSSPQRQAATSDDDMGVDNTPLSSQSQASDAHITENGALKEIPQPKAHVPTLAKGQEAEDSEDEVPVVASQRRVRAGFVLDDSDEE